MKTRTIQKITNGQPWVSPEYGKYFTYILTMTDGEVIKISSKSDEFPFSPGEQIDYDITRPGNGKHPNMAKVIKKPTNSNRYNNPDKDKLISRQVAFKGAIELVIHDKLEKNAIPAFAEAALNYLMTGEYKK